MLSSIQYLLLPVLNSLGPVFLGLAVALLLPLSVSLTHQDNIHWGYIYCLAVSFGLGVFLTVGLRRYRRELNARHGFLLVTLTWALVPLLSTIPLIYALPNISLSALYFETMSCLTTTGGTVLTGLDHLPLSLNGWRSLLSWIGGMGLIVLSVAILPLLGVGGAQIIKAEVSGPLKESKLTPRIADTAKALYLIYLGISILCVIAYHLAGMSWDDAILHMMTTVSLSGISAHDASYAYFNSATIDIVATIFMIICGINFSLHFVALRYRNPLQYFKDREAIGWFFILFLLTAYSTTVLLWTETYQDFLTALRHAAFAVTSVASTTGYTNENWELWPMGIPILLILSSAVATCGGSTGGGLKMIRLQILLHLIQRELKQLLYPKAIIPLKINDKAIDHNLLLAILGYSLVWGLSTFVISMILIISGLPIKEGLSAAIACMANLGPGLGQIGPVSNYAGLNDFQLFICSIAMLIGRLEIFTVFVLFSKTYWRI